MENWQQKYARLYPEVKSITFRCEHVEGLGPKVYGHSFAHTGEICLNPEFMDLVWSKEFPTTTLLHETAHILTPGCGHNGKWRRCFRKILKTWGYADTPEIVRRGTRVEDMIAAHNAMREGTAGSRSMYRKGCRFLTGIYKDLPVDSEGDLRFEVSAGALTVPGWGTIMTIAPNADKKVMEASFTSGPEVYTLHNGVVRVHMTKGRVHVFYVVRGTAVTWGLEQVSKGSVSKIEYWEGHLTEEHEARLNASLPMPPPVPDPFEVDEDMPAGVGQLIDPSQYEMVPPESATITYKGRGKYE